MRFRAELVTVLLLVAITPLAAQTSTNRGDGAQTGDGSTPFTGLAQAPEANMFVGAATTSIPIEVPPGRKNVTPQLALTYNSNGGPSPYGYGWDLPLPHVQRSGKNGVFSCSDTVARQEFVLTMPGATIECTRQSSGVCIPHVEEAFLRIVSDPVNDKWTVFDKGGTKYTFGDTANARTGSDTANDFSSSGSYCAYTDSWALTSIVDPNGNQLDIQYLWAFGVLYPTTIRYGGNGSFAHQFTVAFTWEPRDDHPESSASGTPTALTQRLKQIDVQYIPQGVVSTVRSYVFSYRPLQPNPVGRQTFLESVELLGANGAVLSRQDNLPALTTFLYHEQTPGFDTAAQSPSAITFRQPHTDQGWEDAHNGIMRWTDQDDGVRRDVFDINGDGIPDVVDAWPVHTQHDGCSLGGPASHWDVYLGSPGGFATSATQWAIPYSGLMCDIRRIGLPGSPGTPTLMTTVDITGDGIPDFIDARNSPWTVYPGTYSSSTGWGFGAGRPWYADPGSSYPANIQEIFTNAHIGGWDGNVIRQDLIDMNGDGRPDLVQTPGSYTAPNPTIWTVWLNTGAGFGPAQTFAATYPALSFQSTDSGRGGTVYGTFDVNGDGLPDQVLSTDHPAAPYNGYWSVCLNSGHATDVCNPWYVPQVGQWRLISQVIDGTAHDLQRDFVDINGDGLPDVVDSSDTATNGGYWHVFLNRGDGFESQDALWRAPNALIREDSPGGGQTLKDTFDMDGDGRLDFVDFSAPRVYHAADGAWVQNGANVVPNASGMRANLLISAENGIGSTTYLQYRPWNGVSVPFPVWTVTEISRDDGMCNGGSCVNSPSAHDVGNLFYYSGGFYDPAGRAFRGFSLVAQEALADPGTPHPFVYTYFSQSAASAGKVTATYTFADDNTLHAYSRTTWQCASLTSGATVSCPAEPGICADPITGAPAACPPGTSADTWVRLREVDDSSLEGLGAKTLSTINTAWFQCGNGQFYGNVQDSSKGDQNGSVVLYTHTDYACLDNGTSYLVDKPSHVVTRGTTNTPLEEKWFFYDNLGYGQLGHGNVTEVKSWVDQSATGGSTTCSPVAPSAGSGGCVSTYMGYDGQFGNLTTVTDALNRTTTTYYDSDISTYDSASQIYPAKIVGPTGYTTSRTYDPGCGKMDTETIPYTGTSVPSYRTAMNYDAFCRLNNVWRPGESVIGTPHRSYQYFLGAPGVPTAMDTYSREPNAASGTVLSTVLTDGLGRVIEKKSQGEVNGDAANLATATQYDSVGRVSQQSVPFLWGSPGASAAAYHQYGDPSAGGAGETSFVYDGLGRPLQQTNPNGSQRVMDYSTPWQTTVSDECVQGGCPGSRTVDAHDALDHPTKRLQYDSGGTLLAGTLFGYDEAGRLLTTTQTDGTGAPNPPTKVTTTYDSLGRKVAVLDPDSGTSSPGRWVYGYDLGGNLVYEDDPTTGQHIERCYDSINRLTKKFILTGDAYTAASCSASGAKESYSYIESGFGLGKLLSVTDEAGTYNALLYDVLGRVTYESRTIDPGNDSTLAYMQYAYDAADHVSTIFYPDNELVTYSYDGVGQVNSAVGSETYLIDMTYDVFGRPLTVSHGNGVTDQRTYGGAASNYRLATIQTTVGATNPTTLLSYSYPFYDANGRLTTLNDTSPSHGPNNVLDNGGRYTYDGLGRLTEAQGPQLGDRRYLPGLPDELFMKDGLWLAYSTIHPHQAITYNSQNLGYDPNGDRNASSPRGATYGYDINGRLTSVNNGQERFVYDYTGRRAIRQVGSAVTRYYNKLFEADSDGSITKYYYAGPLLIASSHKTDNRFAAADFDSAVRVASRSLLEPAAIVVRLRRDAQIGFVALVALGGTALLLAPWRRRRAVVGIRVRRGHALGTALLIAAVTPWPIVLLPAPVDATCGGCGGCSPIAVHYHFDHVGSTQLVTSPSGGVIENVRYTPYGEVRARYNGSGTSISFNEQYRYEFGGYETDPTSGLYYAGARWYDAMLGMFETHDAAGQFANPYTYTDWDPINRNDPNGTMSNGWSILLGIFAGPDIASAIDRGTKTGSAWEGLKGFGIALGERGLGPTGSTYGLNLIAPKTFGKPDPTGYAYGLIPIGGTAYGAVQSFHHGDYASGAAGSALTIAEVVFALYGGGAGGSSTGGFQGTVIDVLSKVWNSPNTAIGVAYGLLGAAIDAIVYVLTLGKVNLGFSISLANNAIQFANHPLQQLFGGDVTIGNTISYDGVPADPVPTSNPLIDIQASQHEIQHTYQGQVLGPLYLPAHISGMSTGALATPFTGLYTGLGIADAPMNFMEAGPVSIVPHPW
jgi:RHS repeat-associated protein